MDYTFINGYICIGIWQVISMLVHFSNHWFTGKGTVRRIYHYVAITAILLFPFMIYIIIYLIYFFPLLWFVPLGVAIGYWCLCYDEVCRKMQRPLASLK